MNAPKPRFAILIALVLVASASAVMPAYANPGGTQDAAAAPAPQRLETGKRYKIRGVVTSRTEDGLILKDKMTVETKVVLHEGVKVQIDGKPVTEAQRYELRKLVGGIIAEVQGRGDANGNLWAEKISISSKEMRTAQAMANRLVPVEDRVTKNEEQIKLAQEQNRALAGQVDELAVLSNMAMEEAKKANERVSALDNYTVLETVTVTFPVNSAVLSVQAKKDLDVLAEKILTMKGYAFEIMGFTDTTGNAEKNRVLSEKRANEVVRYLADAHSIPLRRIVTPLGFGAARPAADNTTKTGREANRRVEVRLMQQGGVAQ
ncbi:MAG: OmpA family protein [Blastocatellia bacterium]|nr:OmpA family protein [Blastocatellia bacterium]MBK6425959.1 OmpA family protein [Blastocatellia bacterium]